MSQSSKHLKIGIDTTTTTVLFYLPFLRGVIHGFKEDMRRDNHFFKYRVLKMRHYFIHVTWPSLMRHRREIFIPVDA